MHAKLGHPHCRIALRNELYQRHVGPRVKLHLHRLRVPRAVGSERNGVRTRQNRGAHIRSEPRLVFVVRALRGGRGGGATRSHGRERCVGRRCGARPTSCRGSCRGSWRDRRWIHAKIPRRPVHPCGVSDATQPAHRATVLVRDRHVHLAGGLRFELIGDERARGRILPGPCLLPEVAVAAPFIPPHRGPDVEQRHVGLLCAGHLLEMGDVIQDVQTTSVRREEQIVIARMHLNVAHRVDRHIAPDRTPVHAAIPRRPHAHLGADVQQIPVLRILAHHMHPRRAGRQVSGDSAPGPSVVRRHVGVRCIVVVLVMIGSDVRGAGIEVRRFNGGNPRVRLESGHLAEDVRPVAASVACDLHVAVVGAHPDDVRVERRRSDGEHRAVKLRRGVVHHDRPARGLLLRRVVRGEVGRDYLPRRPVVRRFEQHIASEVDDLRILRRERDGRVPVEPVFVRDHRVAHRAHSVRIRVNRLLCSGARVGDVEHPALRVRVDEPRLVHHRHSEEAVASRYSGPVTLPVSLPRQAPARAAPVAVVLQSAAHHVRPLHVVVDVIELRERKRVHDFEVLARVVAHLPPTIRPAQDVARVGRVDPERLVIAVHITPDRAEVRAAVLGQIQRAGKREHTVGILRIDTNVGVVEGAKIDVRIAADGAPPRSTVVRTPELALVLRLADQVHDVGIARRHGNPDAVHLLHRQPVVPTLAGEPLPRRAAVHRAIGGRVAAPRLEMPRPAPVRVHAGVENVGVIGIRGQIGAAGLRINVEHSRPGLPAIGRPEYAALLVGSPFAAQRAGVDDVRRARVNHDARDLVRLREADVRPVLPRIHRFVHPVANGRVVARISLAGAHVQHVGVARRDGDGTDGGGALLVEDGFEGRARVGGLDDAPVRARHIVDVAIARHADDHRDAPRLVRGTHRAPRDATARLRSRITNGRDGTIARAGFGGSHGCVLRTSAGGGDQQRSREHWREGLSNGGA